MERKGKGAGVSGGILLAGIRGSAPSTLFPRASLARGIQKLARRLPHTDHRPTERRILLLLSAFPNSRFPNRRLALLPFALFVEPLAPVPVGVLNLKTGAAISVPNSMPRCQNAGSAATSQSPELGDWLNNFI